MFAALVLLVLAMAQAASQVHVSGAPASLPDLTALTNDLGGEPSSRPDGAPDNGKVQVPSGSVANLPAYAPRQLELAAAAAIPRAHLSRSGLTRAPPVS